MASYFASVNEARTAEKSLNTVSVCANTSLGSLGKNSISVANGLTEMDAAHSKWPACSEDQPPRRSHASLLFPLPGVRMFFREAVRFRS